MHEGTHTHIHTHTHTHTKPHMRVHTNKLQNKCVTHTNTHYVTYTFINIHIYSCLHTNTHVLSLSPPLPHTQTSIHTYTEEEWKERSWPLKDGVSCAQNAIDDVELPCLKLAHHLRDQVRPFHGEVFSAYDAYGITQLHTNTCINHV